MKRLVLYFLLSQVIVACQYDHPGMPGDKIDELLEKSEEILQVGEHTYILEAYLWRDFMPVSPPGGRPLIAINRLVEKDGKTIPPEVDMIRQYVIMEDQLWETSYSEDIPGMPHVIEKISRDGPKWGPHVYLTVVACVTDNETGTDYFIRVEDIYIERTD